MYHEKIQNSHLDTVYQQPFNRILDGEAKNAVLGLELDIIPASVYAVHDQFNAAFIFQYPQISENDIAVHSRQVWINGYRAEDERTFFI